LNQNSIKKGDPVEVKFNLTNSGTVEAEEVAQIYLTDVQASVKVPIQKLVGFNRVNLHPNETRTITFSITPEMMMLVDENGDSILEAGKFSVRVGGSSPGQRSIELGIQELLEGQFNLT
jgi:beta-glucosidase